MTLKGGDDEATEELDWPRVMAVAIQRERKAARRAALRSGGSGGGGGGGGGGKLVFASCFKRRAAVQPALDGGKASRESLLEQQAVRSSPWPFLGLLVRFTVPMLALFGYYLALYFTSTNVIQQVLGLQAALVGAANRHTCTRETLMNLRRDMMTYGDRDFMRTRYATVQDGEDCVLSFQALLMYGSTEYEERGSFSQYIPALETGIVPTFSLAENNNLYSAQHSDACPWIASTDDAYPPFLATVRPGTVEQCRSFSSGLLTRGLAPATLIYMKRLDALAQRRMRARLYNVPPGAPRRGLGVLLPADSYNFSADVGTWGGAASTALLKAAEIEPPPPYPPATSLFPGDIDPATFWATAPNGTQNYSMAAEFTGSEMQWLVQASNLYLTPGFDHMTVFYFNKGQSTITWLAEFITVFTASFYCCFMAYMVAFYLPQIRSTNHDIISKKSILLLLPFVVINGVPALQEAVTSIFSEDETSGAQKDMSPSTQLASSYISSAGVLKFDSNEDDE